MAKDDNKDLDDQTDDASGNGALTVDQAADLLNKRFPNADADPIQAAADDEEDDKKGGDAERDEPDAHPDDDLAADKEAADKDDDAQDDGTDQDQDDDPDKDADADKDDADKDGDDDAGDAVIFAEDDDLVKIKSGDEEFEVPVSDLKRLYGQEAKITRQSQQVTKELSTAKDASEKYLVALTSLSKRNEERLAIYNGVDFKAKKEEMDPAVWTLYESTAMDLVRERQFFDKKIDEFVKLSTEKNDEVFRQRSSKCLEALQEDVPEWDNDLYNNLRTYAVNGGMDQAIVDKLIDPAAWKIVHKAYQFDNARKKAMTKRIGKKGGKAVTRRTTTRRRSMRTTRQTQDGSKSKVTEAAALQKLRTSGNINDAVDALDARFGSEQ